jgi:hypothetical protein
VTKGRARSLKQLLRNLESPGALVGNSFLRGREPLHARAVVEAAVAALPSRLRIIVTRCDIGHELHTVVARDLGISKRHLYRERDKALTMLGKTLPVVHAAERAPVAVPVDPDAISTTTIDAMVFTGRVSEAIPILEEAVRNAKAVRSQVRLLLTLSGVHGQVGNVEKAEVALRHAASALEGDIDSCLDALRLELATAQANILNFRGKTDEARRRLMRAVAKAGSPLSDRERVEHARALALAQVALANGLMGSTDLRRR